VRQIAEDLRPEMLDAVGFVAAVESHLTSTASRAGLRSTLSGPAYVDLSSERALALFRAFQEAMTNIVRHARATHVTVTVEERADEVAVIVEDNGVGYDPSRSESGHRVSGLAGMQERLELYGGAVEIQPREPRGTIVVLTLPRGAPPDG
jgi:signal transduction histidine kinase